MSGTPERGAVLRSGALKSGTVTVRLVSKPFMVNLDILVILHGSIQEDMIQKFLKKINEKINEKIKMNQSMNQCMKIK